MRHTLSLFESVGVVVVVVVVVVIKMCGMFVLKLEYKTGLYNHKTYPWKFSF